jgi:GNAT superfamily N-acetyltransferase
MSLYSRYVEERLGFKTLEEEGGFITYALRLPECSIEEFYVTPDRRGTSLAKRLADRVFAVAKEAGAERMWARVTPGLKGAEHALKTNLHYGFALAGVKGNDIILVKEIGG